MNRWGEAHLQTPPLYTPDKALLDKAPLDKALIPSLRAIPTLGLMLSVLGQALTTATRPVLAVNWERIKKFRSTL